MADRHRPWFAAVLVGLAVALAACGGGHGGPSAEKVAVHWRQALEKGDYATTWDLEGPDMQADAGKAVAIAARKEDRFGQPLSPGAAAVSIEAVRNRTVTDPDHSGEVWVYLQVDTKDEAHSHLESVGLARIDKEWRVQRREPFAPYVGWVR